jgi:tetratricopeptide (TPR) repeat protein
MTNISPSTIIRSLILQGREDDALKMCRELGVDTPDVYCDALDILESRGDNPRFLSLSENGVRVFPNHPGIMTRHVKALLANRDPGRAADEINDFIERSGDHGLWAMLAECLMLAGRPAEAGEVLQRYMPANPGNSGAWLITARIINQYGHPNLAGIMSGLEYEISTVETEIDENSGRLHFAHGLMLETLGRYEEAMTAFSRGNEILDAVLMSDRYETMENAFELAPLINLEWISDRQSENGYEPEPIFLVGSKHSGSSAIADLLLSSPDVEDAGSMNMLERDLHQRFGFTWEPGYGQGLCSLTKDDISDLRMRYLDTVPKSVSGAKHFIDVALLNIFHISVLKAMFPKARFVFCDCDHRVQAMKMFRSPEAIETHRYSADIGKIRQHIFMRQQIMMTWMRTMASDISYVVTDEIQESKVKLEKLLPGIDMSREPAWSPQDWPDIPDDALSTYSAWIP